MISADFLTTCLAVAHFHFHTPNPVVSDLDFTEDVADCTPRPSIRDSDSNFEAQSYYFGLPSRPASVYQTGAPWKKPTGLEAQRVLNEARPICNHPIADVWDELGPQVPEYLDSVNVKWTTIDVTRFAEVEKDAGPVYLWVGVKPGALSRVNAEAAAVGCKELLKEFQITDVEVAFRESVFTRSAGSQLLKHVSSLNATADVRRPFTPALGLQIAARATPCSEGTGGIHICEGGESKRVFVLAARHVVIPPDAGCNELYSCAKVSRRRRRDVLLLGSKAFQNVLESIMVRIACKASLVDHYKDVLEHLGEAGAQDKERKKYKALVQEGEQAINTLDEFYGEVTRSWSAESQRILGNIAYSPPMSIGPQGFTEDWALVEPHDEKINWDTFKGNVIDLGTFRSSLVRSSNLTIISRHRDFGRRLQAEDVPPPHGPHLQISV